MRRESPCATAIREWIGDTPIMDGVLFSSIFFVNLKGKAMCHRCRHPYRRCYTAGNFLLDVLMTALTGGLWLIWIFCREMRSR